MSEDAVLRVSYAISAHSGCLPGGVGTYANQCAIAGGLTPGEAAMAEPLAVALHGTRMAEEILGKRGF